nr:p19 [Lingue ampelovirus 1]
MEFMGGRLRVGLDSKSDKLYHYDFCTPKDEEKTSGLESYGIGDNNTKPFFWRLTNRLAVLNPANILGKGINSDGRLRDDVMLEKSSVDFSALRAAFSNIESKNFTVVSVGVCCMQGGGGCAIVVYIDHDDAGKERISSVPDGSYMAFSTLMESVFREASRSSGDLLADIVNRSFCQ